MTQSSSFEEIRNLAQKLVEEIAQGLDHKELHRQALDLLLKIVEFQNLSPSLSASDAGKESHAPETFEEQMTKEIQKVARKLKRWAKSQDQINSKILTLFIRLRRSGEQIITEDMLCDEYQDISEFYRNYPQMKSISPKNHGKVFQSKDGVVEIWEPVKQFVDEYERSVFSESDNK